MIGLIIVGLFLLIVFWRIVIYKPYDECRWYQHDYGESWMREAFYDTDKYIDGKVIKRREVYHYQTCKKCGNNRLMY